MSRNWVFTLNNPTPQDDAILDFTNEQRWSNRVSFAIWMLETSESGTPHYQGYLEATSPIRIPWLKKRLPRAHFDRRRGSRQEAIGYCLKTCFPVNENGSWRDFLLSDANIMLDQITSHSSRPNIFPNSTSLQELVTLLTVGARKSRLDIMKEKLDSGATEEELADEDFGSWVRHYRAFREYRLMKTPARNHEVEVIVLQGPTGTGKSKFAMDAYPDAYWKQRSQWWDGYNKQETIVLDEFYGWIPYDLLLRLCDRYPLLLETKGGQVQCVAKRVVITTNSTPGSWYRNAYFPAFARRVSKWMVLPRMGEVHVYDEYDRAVDNFIST